MNMAAFDRMKYYVAALLAAVLVVTSAGVPVQAGSNYPTVAASAFADFDAFDDFSLQQLESALAIIEQIPDYILAQGDSATREWLKKHFGYQGSIQPEGFFGCVGAIGTALLGIAFPAAKITKIKDAIKAAGGVNKVVTVIRDSYKTARSLGIGKSEAIKIAVQDAFRTASSETFSLLLSFFGISSIIGECFE
ncbi:hypothetical protein [Paenibacillus tarimensis]|uniref:hypothetical protein n=1 Tax=Paenibacillus tarimensis TaxID=416012 RepID=UPI001F40BD20|nr:hypothetical protein [Paenibacillus tarimensis]MCF2945803.1 hypothetical protein [Paenibacillus tarimensis]